MTPTDNDEPTLVAQRDAILAQLRTTRDYKTAIAQATTNPAAFYSFPLLTEALDIARNVPVVSNGMGGHMADVHCLFPALNAIHAQSYAYTVYRQVAAWAPLHVLENADAFAREPYAAALIAYAAKRLEETLPRDTYPKRPPAALLRAFCCLPEHTREIAARTPLFAHGLRYGQQLYEHFYNKRAADDAPAEIKADYEALAPAFAAAHATLDAPPNTSKDTRLLVLSSPSGGGKTTQRRFLLADDPTREFLVSYTTRAPRHGEIDGVDYHFLRIGRTEAEAKAAFDQLVQKGELFEHTEFYGNRYGTPKAQLEAGLNAGKQLLADVNLAGLNAFTSKLGKAKLCSIFLMPPSLDALRERLAERLKNTPELSDAERGRREAENAQRIAQAPGIIGESRYYQAVIDQTDCSPEEASRLLKKALSTPHNTVASYSIVRLGKQCHSGNSAPSHS